MHTGKDNTFKLTQPSKHCSETFVSIGKSTCSSFARPANALLPTVLSLASDNAVTSVQPLKASASIVSISGSASVVKPVQPSNAFLPMYLIDAPLTVVNATQPLKAPSPILVNTFANGTLFNDLQPLKRSTTISLSCGSVTSSKASQSINAPLPILSPLRFGICTFFNFLQPSNAFSPIASTAGSSIVSNAPAS